MMVMSLEKRPNTVTAMMMVWQVHLTHIHSVRGEELSQETAAKLPLLLEKAGVLRREVQKVLLGGRFYFPRLHCYNFE